MKISVDLTETQIKVLIASLDVYSRIMLGQLGDVAHTASGNKRFSSSEGVEIFLTFKECLESLEPMITGMPKNSGHSISSPNISDTARVAFDLQQAIRYAFSWHKSPQGGFGVWFDKPLQYSQEPLPVVQVK